MGLSRFSYYNGSNPYIFEEYSSLPSENISLASPVHKHYSSISHSRSGIIFARKLIGERYRWDFFFRNISISMVRSLEFFFDQAFFRFYPDTGTGDYFVVYLLQDDIKPELQRGGTYNLAFSLGQK